MDTYSHILPPGLRRILMLCLHDLKHIFRDKALWAVVIAPVLIMLMLRGGIPIVESWFPFLIPYRIFILALFCMAASVLPAYLMAFLMLDEKDEQVILAIRVLPVPPLAFLGYRLGLMTIWGFGICMGLIHFSGMREIPFLASLGLSALVSMGTPMTYLFVVTYAQNKVEGLALLKGFNFVGILPIFAFVIDNPVWEYLTSIIPFYWVFRSFDAVGNEMYAIGWSLGIGAAIHLAVLVFLFKKFRQYVF